MLIHIGFFFVYAIHGTCYVQILQDSTKVWMTAPEIVRETTKRDMKTIK